MGKLISVVMSVYNEKIEWIKDSVKSILGQSYTNIEFIIVIDNPGLDREVKEYLENTAKTDGRVVLLQNKENVGLAKSLNRGIAAANGAYIARMDADDISEKNRLDLQIQIMEKGKYDLVGTGKINIDEKGNLISGYSGCDVENKKIKSILPYTSCFVHPSVLMRTDVVKRNHGYRNFRQSQDYDLWLRMLTDGCRFYNVDCPLIRYRVRNGGISARKPYVQFMTAQYERNLYKQRRKRGTDTFSEEGLENYLNRHKAYDIQKNKKYSESLLILEKGIGEIKRKRFIGIWHMICAVFYFSEMLKVLEIKIKIILLSYCNYK